MTTTTADLRDHARFTYEGAGWITLREPRPRINTNARDLLAASADPRPGNLRFTIDAGAAFMLGEVRDRHGLMAVTRECERMKAGVCETALEVSHVDVACALTETGYEWSTLQDAPGHWQAVASDPRGCRCELLAKIVPGGVEVRGLLTAWDSDLSEASQEAVARFLIAAHDRVRFARFTLHNRNAAAVSFASVDRLDVELPDSVFAAVAACGLVWREVRALSNDAVARAYLEVFE